MVIRQLKGCGRMAGMCLAVGMVLVACSQSSNDKPEEVVQEDVIRADSRPNIIFIFTDDHGYADLGAQGVVDDIKTPHLDAMAAEGVRMLDGYVTAPQCTPSRAALMSGRYQQRFGVDDNAYTPFPLSQATLAERLSEAGYKTGMVGKWHLEIDGNSAIWYREEYAPGATDTFDTQRIPKAEKVKYYPDRRGFQDIFFGYADRYRATFDLSGKSFSSARTVRDKRFRVDVTSDAAVTFIDRHRRDPFFLYVAYYAPHVPLEATDEYLSRFPEDMPERRRYGLAMLAAIDDGVGRIMARLRNYGLDDDTIVFFISDNGAPLAKSKEDVLPVSTGGFVWDGSLNEPWLGEKGMLSEGAIRVPYVVSWPGHLPAGLAYSQPVTSLDAPATAAALAQIDTSDLDGVNLIPYLNDANKVMDRALYWRFWRQSAVRQGPWKYLRVGNQREYLFDLESEQHENENLLAQNPDVAARLRQSLTTWAETLKLPGVPIVAPGVTERDLYDFHFTDDGS